jgi:hypothetical protein
VRPIPGALCFLSVAAMIAAAFLAFAGGRPALAQASCTSNHEALDGEELEMLALINAERAKVGSPPLTPSLTANRAAAWMSQDIADHSYFAHEPDSLGRTFAERFRDCGMTNGYRGENLAIAGDARNTFQAWVASPAHRDNMLNPVFTYVGIGRVGRVWALALSSEDGDSAASTPGSVDSSHSAGAAATVKGPLWVNDLEYGSRGGGFYWDAVSGRVWTAERGWHLFAPPVRVPRWCSG